MIENKENGDTETWSDIKKEFENAFNYWIYEFDKKNLSVDFILTVQDLFSNCFDILQCNQSERDYVAFSQSVELLKILWFPSDRRRDDRVLMEIHYK